MRSAILVSLVVLGCGHAEPPAASAQDMKPAAGPPEVREPAPSSSIRRSEVRQFVKNGVGALMQRVIVDVDKPVFRQGKFLGFRITQMPRDWAGVDLKPGDVVTAVNGFSIERPEAAYEAMQSLEVASELRVDYERNGEPRSLRYAIVDD